MPINFSHVYYTYLPKSPFEYTALENINLGIKEGSFTAIIGHTGSGKSTLVQHINALLRPTSGEVTVGDFVISSSTKKIKGLVNLKKYAGLVFQFPEYQLFEETVLKDVAFGPKNFKENNKVAFDKAKKALLSVGIDENLFDKSPFELSGGQKRRVAIAGIIALEPKILVLDEPTAGLDPKGAKEMMNLFKQNNENGTTIIMITHDMNNVLTYCNQVVVMKKARVEKVCTPIELFKDDNILHNVGLEEPHIISFAKKLIKKGLNLNLNLIRDLNSLVDEIVKARKNK